MVEGFAFETTVGQFVHALPRSLSTDESEKEDISDDEVTKWSVNRGLVGSQSLTYLFQIGQFSHRVQDTGRVCCSPTNTDMVGAIGGYFPPVALQVALASTEFSNVRRATSGGASSPSPPAGRNSNATGSPSFPSRAAKVTTSPPPSGNKFTPEECFPAGHGRIKRSVVSIRANSHRNVHHRLTCVLENQRSTRILRALALIPQRDEPRTARNGCTPQNRRK